MVDENSRTETNDGNRQRGSFFRSDSGASLVAVLIAVGLLGIMASMMAQRMSLATKSQVDLERKLDFQALNRFVLESAHCALTVAAAPNPCPEGTYVDVKTSAQNGKVIIQKFNPSHPGSLTVFGEYSVRAKCGPNRALIIEARRTRDSNPAYRDIFPDVPFGCVMP